MIRGLEESGAQAGDTMIVIGAGPIGLDVYARGGPGGGGCNRSGEAGRAVKSSGEAVWGAARCW